MSPEQIYMNQFQQFQRFQQFQQSQPAQLTQVPETQFKVPQSKPKEKDNRRKGKRPAKPSSIPAVDLSGEDDNIDDDDDIVVTAPQRWTPAEETMLAKVWVAVSEDNERGDDQTMEFFWNSIYNDFNQRNPTRRTKNMLTGKWNRTHPDVQKFHAIFKSLNQKSGQNEADVIEAAKKEFAACNNARKFAFEHVWRVLKEYPKWDAPEGLNEDDHTEIYGQDARPRPPGKPKPAKKTRSDTTDSSGSVTSKEDLNDELLLKIRAGKEMYQSRKAKADIEMEFKEMEFLSIKTSDLPEPNKTIIERKQAKIAEKYNLIL